VNTSVKGGDGGNTRILLVLLKFFCILKSHIGMHAYCLPYFGSWAAASQPADEGFTIAEVAIPFLLSIF